MKLVVKDHNNVIDRDFANWLLEQVKDECYLRLDPTKLKRISHYLNTSDTIPRLHKLTHYDASDIIVQGIQNLKFNFSSSNSFDIHINSNIYADGFDRFNLLSACKLINYGNQDIAGFPIFTSAFEAIMNKIPEYIYHYYGV